MGFLGLVRCGYPKRASRLDAAVEAAPSSDQQPKGAAAPAVGKKRRHRPADAQWRPSLGPISEDAVVRVVVAAEGEKNRADARVTAPEKTKKAPISQSAAVTRARSRGSSNSQLAAQQAAIPALASAPFWF